MSFARSYCYNSSYKFNSRLVFIVTYMNVYMVAGKVVCLPQVGNAQEVVFQLIVFMLITLHSKGTFFTGLLE